MKNSIIKIENAASRWAEAFPLGNGRIGAMVYGDPFKEQIALNHDLLWRSYLKQPVYEANKDIEKFKELCLKKEWVKANELIQKTVPSRNAIYINPFVPACDIFMKMINLNGMAENYTRMLDLENGIAKTEFISGGVTYTRESFCPIGENIFIMRLSASIPGMITSEVSLSRIPDAECEIKASQSYGMLTVTGTFDEGKTFSAAVKILYRNGRLGLGKRTYGIENEAAPERKFGLGYVFDRDLKTEAERGMSLFTDSCDEVILVASVTVDKESENCLNECIRTIEKKLDYQDIKNRQKEKFSSYFNRTKISLSEVSKDIEMLYNTSRYVAIASGMPQNEEKIPNAPINLQGIWNRDTRPAWESDYHLDLNIEMCYWALASAGLTEFYEPFLQWVERLLPQAQKAAQDMYGCEGAAYNGCCDPWTLGSTDLVGFGWLGGGAWLCQILWIYYEYSPSEELLKRIYEIMKQVSLFLEKNLIEENGKLTFPFGSSPEMSQKADGTQMWISSASTCDISLAKELFERMKTASEILGESAEIQEKYTILANSLRNLPIDESGCLQEWCDNHEEAEPGHRHRSPFICFCPGNSITTKNAPEIVKAMEKLLEKRTNSTNKLFMSFSHVWDAQILARMGKGNKALNMIKNLTKVHVLPNFLITINDWQGIGEGSSWFPDVQLFQIEAQLGLISSITELFIQDTDYSINVLPALPDEIPSGSLKGVNLRGGFIADIEWKNGKATNLTLTSNQGNTAEIYLPQNTLKNDSIIPQGAKVEGNKVTFITDKSKTYTLIF